MMLQWGFPYLLTSPRPHTLQLGQDSCERHIQVEHNKHQLTTTRLGRENHHSSVTTEILYTDVTTRGLPPPASTVSAQLATVSSQQCATCPSLIAIHLTGPSSGTRCEKEHHSSPHSLQKHHVPDVIHHTARQARIGTVWSHWPPLTKDRHHEKGRGRKKTTHSSQLTAQLPPSGTSRLDLILTVSNSRTDVSRAATVQKLLSHDGSMLWNSLLLTTRQRGDSHT